MRVISEKRKLFSLNRRILKIVIAVYMFFISILSLIVLNSILKYQETRDGMIRSEIESSLDDISESADSIKDQAFHIYDSSGSLKLLEKYVDNTRDFDSLMDLQNDLERSSLVINPYDSIWAFYDNYRQFAYKLNETVDLDQLEKMKADCGRLLRENRDAYGKTIFSYDQHTYYVVHYKKSGVGVVGLTELTDLLPKDAAYHFAVVYDQNIYANDGEEIPFERKDLKPGKNRLTPFTTYYIEDNRYKIGIAAWKKNTIWTYMKPVHFWLVCLLILTVFPMMKFLDLIDHQLVVPLRNMTATMRRIQSGNLENFQSDTNVEEIEEVKKSISTMIQEILSWQKRTYEEKIERQTAQMQYLQLQLEPHFYLNCLNNANAALMVQKYDYVQEYLILVSNHFQYLMRNCMEFVPLERELEFVSNYLRMMKREEQCEISFDESVRKCRIPILTIQSFVENSIKYAVSDIAGLRMKVNVQRFQTEEGDFLNIVVSDNGKGYPEEVLKILNTEAIPTLEDHVGIINLRKRMEILYEGKAQCFFDNRAGAVSDLLLPYLNGGDAGEDSDRR